MTVSLRMFFLLASCLTSSLCVAEDTVIDFDDIDGQESPFSGGTSVTVLVDDEYEDLGVLFDSGGGGIFIADASNPVSEPNVAAASHTTI